MTRPRPVEIEFEPDDMSAVVARMATLAASRSGWVNVRPVIRPEDTPPRPGIFAVFGNAANKVPTGTWLPGKLGRDGTAKPATIGLLHGSGPRVVPRLRGLGHGLPEGWRVVQDHPRRGLVAHVPDGTDPGTVLDWLVGASTVLCEVPMTGRWEAALHAEAGSAGLPSAGQEPGAPSGSASGSDDGRGPGAGRPSPGDGGAHDG